MKKAPVNYVDNKEFLSLLISYREARQVSIDNGTKLPTIPNKLGHIFIQIANKLSTRYNFVNYTYRDEMVSDGILNAIEAVHKFNPDLSQNPFGYFTKIIFWAFVRRIEHEKRDHKMRDDMMFDITNDFYVTQNGESYDLQTDEAFLWYNQ